MDLFIRLCFKKESFSLVCYGLVKFWYRKFLFKLKILYRLCFVCLICLIVNEFSIQSVDWVSSLTFRSSRLPKMLRFFIVRFIVKRGWRDYWDFGLIQVMSFSLVFVLLFSAWFKIGTYVHSAGTFFKKQATISLRFLVCCLSYTTLSVKLKKG